MSIPSVYINLEDDVSKVAERLRRQASGQVVLVCPKRCQLFSDSINLRLLKKQADMLGKEVFILTMDERGQVYAKEAGFALKFLPKVGVNRSVSDVRPYQKPQPYQQPEEPVLEKSIPVDEPVTEPKEQMAYVPPAKIVGPKFNSAVRGMVHEPLTEEYPPSPEEMVEPEESNKPELPVEQPELLAPVEPVIRETQNFFPPEIEDEYRSDEKKSALPKIILGVLAVSVAIALLLYFVILPKATVVVYPKTEDVSRDMQISLSAAAQQVDASKLILPAVKISQTVNVSDKFQSQGQSQVGNTASGTVKIYNFTKVPISLKAATTVLTVGNKTYNLTADVTNLKPTLYLDARTKEVDPNSLGDSVGVVAAQGGDDYNLPSGTRMEISNQVFGSRPQLLYAKTDSEINGGTTRYLSVIAQSDISGAQTQLQKDALSQVRQKLQDSGEILAEGGYSITVSQFSTDNPAGTQTPSFQGSLTASIVGLAFKQDDLDNLINQRIGQTLAANKTLEQPSPSQTTYTVQNLDLNNLVATLQAHFQGQAVYAVDLGGVVSQLRGKSASQVDDILSSKGQIQKVEIVLAPVWQKRFPWLTNNISVTVASTVKN
ncbi:MAG: hypothetical protein P4L74_05820 [Candidatus Doudnabacteria bacterium]|nr:hypothetical protein [Candidatus Doudnabacteria bacterium]